MSTILALVVCAVQVGWSGAMSADPHASNRRVLSMVGWNKNRFEHIEQMLAKFPRDPALLAQMQFVEGGIGEANELMRAGDYAAAETRMRVVLEGCDGWDERYVRWMLAEKLFLQRRFAEVREVLAPAMRPVWDEPPLLMDAIRRLQMGDDTPEIREYIRQQVEAWHLDDFPLPDVETRQNAIAAGYYALGCREAGRTPVDRECIREAHRLMPRNIAIATSLAVRETGSAERKAEIVKAVFPYVSAEKRRHLITIIRQFDPSFVPPGDGG